MKQTEAMGAELAAALDGVLRNLLTAGSQYFFHQLVFRAHGFSDLEAGYGRGLFGDVVWSFRLILLLQGAGYDPLALRQEAPFGPDLPRVGTTFPEIVAHDLALGEALPVAVAQARNLPAIAGAQPARSRRARSSTKPWTTVKPSWAGSVGRSWAMSCLARPPRVRRPDPS